MAQIHLIRHGQASFGQANYDCLSAIGEQQADVVGQHYAQVATAVAAVYSGSLQRQADTADIARRHNARWPTRVVDTAFNEFDAEGLFSAYLPQVLQADATLRKQLDGDIKVLFSDRKLFQQVFDRLIQLWTQAAPVPSGTRSIQTWAEFTARVEAGLQRLHAAHGEQDIVLVVTSGGVISAATRAALALDDVHSFRINWNIANASVTRFITRASGLYLHSFNNFTHLELTGDARLVTYR